MSASDRLMVIVFVVQAWIHHTHGLCVAFQGAFSRRFCRAPYIQRLNRVRGVLGHRLLTGKPPNHTPHRLRPNRLHTGVLNLPSTSRFCHSRPASPDRILSKPFGSLYATVAYQAGYSDPMIRLSRSVARPGTNASTSPGRSCPSDVENRHMVLINARWYQKRKRMSFGL